MNGPSDHDAQLIIVNNIKKQSHQHQSYFTRTINKYTTAEFHMKQSYKTWGSVFNGDDVIVIFNFF